MENYPPYTITDKMLDYIAKIMEKVGEINSYTNLNKMPELRKQNRINSIHSSLAIENNKLSEKEVKDIIDGHIVIGDKQDIQEVKNAYEAYEKISKINPYSIEDLKKIHGIMTFLTVERTGKFRNHGEGVYDGDRCIFMAPPENMVPELMKQLFKWMNEAKDKVHPLILSSVFHYEFVFIHPFSDGNGRMARIWQTTILSKWKEIFEYVPIESLIKKYQNEYYEAINNSNNAGNSNEFIEFMLKMINETLDKLLQDSQDINMNKKFDKKLEGLNDTERLVLNYIAEKSLISTSEIAKYIEKTDRTARRIVAKLEEKELITWEGLNEKDPNKKYKLN